MKIITLVEDTPGNSSCQYEHGLSIYIETNNHKLLVDTGATDIFLKNAQKLNIDLKSVDTVILSHGHYDHSGGILAFSQINPTAKIYLKESATEDYYSFSSGYEKYIGIDKNIPTLSQTIFVNGDKKIDEELFLYTNITGRKNPAKSNLLLKKRIGETFVQDNFDHEQCLVITCEDKHILISGCAHNGILNILDRYREIFHTNPDMVISGFHMVKKTPYDSEEIRSIQNTAAALLETDALFYTGHCTSQLAFDIMKPIMGDKLRAIHSGVTILE
ncbi:MAG: MBL fold metallo-hydrolase [Lachnospiraceae bacterium]|nr:MBL fold metallo-hydrolase [Lachnospiraceae bacterium]